MKYRAKEIYLQKLFSLVSISPFLFFFSLFLSLSLSVFLVFLFFFFLLFFSSFFLTLKLFFFSVLVHVFLFLSYLSLFCCLNLLFCHIFLNPVSSCSSSILVPFPLSSISICFLYFHIYPPFTFYPFSCSSVSSLFLLLLPCSFLFLLLCSHSSFRFSFISSYVFLYSLSPFIFSYPYDLTFFHPFTLVSFCVFLYSFSPHFFSFIFQLLFCLFSIASSFILSSLHLLFYTQPSSVLSFPLIHLTVSFYIFSCSYFSLSLSFELTFLPSVL